MRPFDTITNRDAPAEGLLSELINGYVVIPGGKTKDYECCANRVNIIAAMARVAAFDRGMIDRL